MNSDNADNADNAEFIRRWARLRENVGLLACEAERLDPAAAVVLKLLEGVMFMGDPHHTDRFAQLCEPFAIEMLAIARAAIEGGAT